MGKWFFILEFHFCRKEFTWAHFKLFFFNPLLCPLSFWANSMLAISVEFSLFPGGLCYVSRTQCRISPLSSPVTIRLSLRIKFYSWHVMIFSVLDCVDTASNSFSFHSFSITHLIFMKQPQIMKHMIIKLLLYPYCFKTLVPPFLLSY